MIYKARVRTVTRCSVWSPFKLAVRLSPRAFFIFSKATPMCQQRTGQLWRRPVPLTRAGHQLGGAYLRV